MSDPTNDTNDASREIPVAALAPERRFTWALLLPVLAAAFAVYLGVQAFSSQGIGIQVTALEGHGLKEGDPLRYRGITVGDIEAVRLTPDLSRVVFDVRLDRHASALAREGSRFWVVRPHVTLDSVQGLETIVGARYLAVVPGPYGGKRVESFDALEEPPVREPIDPSGLTLTLEGPRRFSLAPGAPVSYREIQVGSVLGVDLSSDATSVEVEIYVRPTYAQLVRENTRFWEVGGVEFNLALMGGLEVDMGSLRSLFVGGVALATPPEFGPPVRDGHRFALEADPGEGWLEWTPAIPIGEAILPPGVALPRPIFVEVSFTRGLLRRSTTRTGLGVALPGGLVGPADVLIADEDARAGSATLALGDQRVELAEPRWTADGLAFIPTGVEGLATWPGERTRVPTAVEDCLVVGDPASDPVALSAARLAPVDGGWEVEGDTLFDELWHGAAVVARGDGALIGLLLVGEKAGRVVHVKPPVAGGE